MGLLWKEAHNGGLEGHDDDLEDEEGDADKAETENLASVEGDHEAFVLVEVALIGYLDVGVGCNLHADIACQHRGECADQVGDHCVGTLDVAPGLIDSQEDHERENDYKNAEEGVFFS